MDMKESQMKYTRCKRCNRPLTNDVARQRGYGNHCWHLHNVEFERKQNHLFDLPKNIKWCVVSIHLMGYWHFLN
jgi:hypothetical protein